jgi:hypothetical protein
MPRPKPSDMQDGVRIPENSWYTEIVNRLGADEIRKIRVCAFTKERAVRSAREYCCPGEYVKILYDKNMQPVWNHLDDAAPPPKQKRRRKKVDA